MQTPRNARRWIVLSLASTALLAPSSGCGGANKSDGSSAQISDEANQKNQERLKNMREEAIAKFKKGARRP